MKPQIYMKHLKAFSPFSKTCLDASLWKQDSFYFVSVKCVAHTPGCYIKDSENWNCWKACYQELTPTVLCGIGDDLSVHVQWKNLKDIY